LYNNLSFFCQKLVIPCCNLVKINGGNTAFKLTLFKPGKYEQFGKVVETLLVQKSITLCAGATNFPPPLYKHLLLPFVENALNLKEINFSVINGFIFVSSLLQSYSNYHTAVCKRIVSFRWAPTIYYQFVDD
jgi:hypothetical protein